ncbi:TRAP transporter large permease [Pueribacillus theae]|uniref:TRAP transporter large permease n=1 Tax=Pueribacillus theae TaxID=2171751 RepID=A0A2U1K1A7_9BACI|nr:TRAP transporter large permease subunit [Pueribacillus theae]PWA10748.1 TRAP transporter large permease [Pueribacillus theae]
MPVEVIGFIGIIVMFVLMAIRVPIAIAMMVPAIIGIYYIRGWDAVSTSLHTIVWNQTSSYTLATIPMFILMGQLLYISGISSELFNMFRVWTGSLRGGLGIATVGASAIFSAASGSSLANTGTMGVVASKEMLNSGYDKSLSAGAIIAGGTLGILIPPSTAFIVYGLITEVSIGKLLIAGIIPGIILALLYMITIYVSVLIKPQFGPAVEKTSWKEKFSSFKSIYSIALLFILVIGGMYFGLFTPTEAAGVGAFGALVIGLIRRRITLKSFITALNSTLTTTSFIFAIVVGAFILSYFMVLTKIPTYLSDFLTSTNLSTLGILMLIVLMYIILGAVMDSLSMIVVTLPIILPTLVALEVDLIWFGVIVVLLIEMAMITPPIGMLCFVLNDVAPEMGGLNTIFKGALRFVIPLVIMIVLLFIFPTLALFLPSSSF